MHLAATTLHLWAYAPAPHGFGGGGILRALGIAYLLHAVFGWGHGGGSPYRLVFLVVIIVSMIARSRGWGPMRR
jgi:hypothetical protein